MTRTRAEELELDVAELRAVLKEAWKYVHWEAHTGPRKKCRQYPCPEFRDALAHG